jgi:transcriptional regulator GlxA family with amidase domain
MKTPPASGAPKPELGLAQEQRTGGSNGTRPQTEAPSGRVCLPECEANCRLAGIIDWPERARQEDYSVRALAASCKVTVRTLQRFFVASFGEPPKRRFQRWRMERARALLNEGKMVKEAATEVLYRSSSHFSGDFKNFYGFNPKSRSPLMKQTEPPA